MNRRWLKLTSAFHYCICAGVLLLALVAFMRMAYQVPIVFFVRDISVIRKIHPLAGSVSSIGAFLWAASAATCFFTVFVFRNIGFKYGFGFLLSTGFLSLYLMLDDFFVVHELLVPRYFGLQQKIVIGILVFVVAVYLASFRKIILQSNCLVMFLALMFFAFSVTVDQFFDDFLKSYIGDWEDFIEDGAKLLGILCWLGYIVDTSAWLLLNQDSFEHASAR